MPSIPPYTIGTSTTFESGPTLHTSHASGSDHLCGNYVVASSDPTIFKFGIVEDFLFLEKYETYIVVKPEICGSTVKTRTHDCQATNNERVSAN